jgi:hypothetical protein
MWEVAGHRGSGMVETRQACRIPSPLVLPEQRLQQLIGELQLPPIRLLQ